MTKRVEVHYCDREPVGWKVPAVQKVTTPGGLRGDPPEGFSRYYCEKHRVIVEELPIVQTLD